VKPAQYRRERGEEWRAYFPRKEGIMSDLEVTSGLSDADIYAEAIELRNQLRSLRRLVAQHPQKPIHALRIPLYHLDSSLGHLAAAIQTIELQKVVGS